MPSKSKGKTKTVPVVELSQRHHIDIDVLIQLSPVTDGEPDAKAADFFRFRYFERTPEERKQFLAKLGLSVEEARAYFLDSMWPADGTKPTDLGITEG